MKKVIYVMVSLLALPGSPFSAQEITGEWRIRLAPFQSLGELPLTLSSRGAILNGTLTINRTEMPVTGSLNGDEIRLSLKATANGNDAEMLLTGVLAGGVMKGRVEITGRSIGEWSARRPDDNTPESKTERPSDSRAVNPSADSATSSAPARNYLVHPPGTKTAPPGALGEVVKGGRGPVDMILLPSGGFGAQEFSEFMQQNAELYTMYAITPAGFAGTPPPPIADGNDYHQRSWVRSLAQGVVQLISERKLNRPVLVGHFLIGDYFALRLALDHQDLFSAVVLIDGNPNYALPLPPEATTAEAVRAARLKLVRAQLAPLFQTVSDERWVKGLFPPERFCLDQQRATALYEKAKAAPKTVMIRYALEFFTDDPGLELRGLRLPVLVIRPIPDAASGLSEERRRAIRTQNPWLRYAADMPDLTLQYIENARTFAWLDQPAAVRDALAEFVKTKRLGAR